MNLKSRLRGWVRSHVGSFQILFLVRLFQWPLRAGLRRLLRRLPRDSSFIVFGSAAERFGGNSAYLYLAMAADSSLRCMWITGSAPLVDRLHAAGLPVARRWSRAGVWAALRAGCYVFNAYRSDINMWLSDGALAVNLWHGVGPKRIQREREVGAGAALYASPEGSLIARVFADDRLPPDYVLSTGAMMTARFAAAFGVPHDRCLDLGYPRNDHLVAGQRPPAALYDPALYDTIDSRHPVVGYFPTFRDTTVSIPIGTAELSRLADLVGEQGGVLLFKPHEASVVPVSSAGSLVVLPTDCDLCAYLGLCDVLITDYSSVALDFLPMDRPIVLFVPDMDEYRHDRGFILDPADFMPGSTCRSLDELVEILGDVAAITPAENFARLRELWWEETSRPGAAQRVAGFLRDGRHRDGEG